jgi:hypothetical protein
MRFAMLLVFLTSWASPGFTADALHGEFGQVLSANVSGTVVNYPGIGADPRFARYLEKLNTTRAGDLSGREEKLAYWINAYNAFAIQGILQGYSPSSLFGRFGYFLTNKFHLGGAEISLYDLEHEILIPQKEPRIHFAINCASMSCPLLRSHAYLATDLNRQLEDSARQFINDPSRNRFDRENKIAYLSKIFDWFEDDFARHSGSVLAYVAGYVEHAELAEGLRNHDYTIEYLEYDWTLNGIAPES